MRPGVLALPHAVHHAGQTLALVDGAHDQGRGGGIKLDSVDGGLAEDVVCLGVPAPAVVEQNVGCGHLTVHEADDVARHLGNRPGKWESEWPCDGQRRGLVRAGSEESTVAREAGELEKGDPEWRRRNGKKYIYKHNISIEVNDSHLRLGCLTSLGPGLSVQASPLVRQNEQLGCKCKHRYGPLLQGSIACA